ncbi:cytochrome c maturation protein CcmE [Paracoccaceae bacterium]|jgi:cytochrome c-type biogenesis protein CcmE|nr:cytochrome c maturation protein CcmE [Paracoccaceae bacterium]|tara:strand:- start:64 stop:459 length:396 start_codon:yes stop_codon:yes gene_type:complete
MKLMIYLAAACCVFATSVSSQTRYFLFPSEVPSYSSQFSGTINVFGIAQYAKNTDPVGAHFSLTDKNGRISVVYDDILPDLFEVDSPVVVQGKFDGNIFKATAIFVKFSADHMPIPALNELRSYGVLITGE